MRIDGLFRRIAEAIPREATAHWDELDDVALVTEDSRLLVSDGRYLIDVPVTLQARDFPGWVQGAAVRLAAQRAGVDEDLQVNVADNPATQIPRPDLLATANYWTQPSDPAAVTLALSAELLSKIARAMGATRGQVMLVFPGNVAEAPISVYAPSKHAPTSGARALLMPLTSEAWDWNPPPTPKGSTNQKGARKRPRKKFSAKPMFPDNPPKE